MTSGTLAKRLIALAKRPKTLANVTLAKSIIGEITAIPKCSVIVLLDQNAPREYIKLHNGECTTKQY